MVLDIDFAILDTSLTVGGDTHIGYTNPIKNQKRRLIKLELLNKGADMELLLYEKYYFYGSGYYLGKIYQKAAGRFQTYSRSRFYLKKDSSIIIYTDKHRNPTDTFFIHLFWKRESVGLDELKFYKNEKKELKYHSARKLLRGYELRESYKWFQNSPIVPAMK